MTPTLAPWFGAAYGLVLLLVAYGIDGLARRAHNRFQDQRNGGFVYHEDHDAWLCPEDQWLWPQSFDPGNRVMRYRGSPLVCNSCPVKDTCTPSKDGREVQRIVDSWPHTESARFHRGIACAVSVLAAAWPAVMALSADGLASQLVLLGVTLLVVLGSLPLWSHLRQSPADPFGAVVRSLDDTTQERQQAAVALARSRSSYASDKRTENAN